MAMSTQFEQNHQKKIKLFRVFGLWLIRQKGKKYVLENGSYTFSRIIWMLWHIIGISAGMWIKEILNTRKDKFHTNGPWLDISTLLVVLYIVGPAQLQILWRNQKWLPIILPDIKKLEDMGDKEFGPLARNMKSNQNDQAETGSIDSSNEALDEAPKGCFGNCCSKFNRLVNKISFTVLTIVLIGLFAAAAWKESTWTDTKDEWKLVVMMFYLVFPMVTTWICIILIDHHGSMYKVISNMKGSSFKDPNTIRKVSDYMSQMCKIFETMNDHIFQLTLGINFGIFVIVGVTSMFEILQGLLERKQGDTSFSDILYVIPLLLSLFHIYKVAHASDHLYHHIHHGLFLKLKKLLPDLLMPQPQPSDFKDVPFKKLELVYKTIKDWPPKVCVYGGYKVNYQILTGMIFFIFAYARVFIKISGGAKAKGTATVTTISPIG